MEKQLKLVVQIPAFNESQRLAAVIKNIPRQIENISEVTVLVLDDGSTDNTSEIAKEAGANYVFRNKRNIGLSANFKKALDASLKLGADIIVNIDGDGQFDSNQIPQLLRPIVDHQAEVVIGSRFLNKDTALVVPTIKRLPNHAFSWVMSKITGQKLSDAQCGFRAYSQEAALRLNLYGHFTYTQESLIDLIDKGLTIKEIPIKVTYFAGRQSAISGNLIKYGLRSLGLIARATRDTKPMEFFGWPGLVSFTLGFIGGLYSFIFWLINHATGPIKTLFIASIFFMTFGALLIVFGLLADMLKRVKRSQEQILYHLKKNILHDIRNKNNDTL